MSQIRLVHNTNVHNVPDAGRNRALFEVVSRTKSMTCTFTKHAMSRTDDCGLSNVALLTCPENGGVRNCLRIVACCMYTLRPFRRHSDTLFHIRTCIVPEYTFLRALNLLASSRRTLNRAFLESHNDTVLSHWSQTLSWRQEVSGQCLGGSVGAGA